MSRWTKLQKELYRIIDPNLNFQIHSVSYPMNSQRGTCNIPRYWITVDDKIIWDYPADFKDTPDIKSYPYENAISSISELIREYIDTPEDQLLDEKFVNDHWGLTDILRASDRRIGKRRLRTLLLDIRNDAASYIIRKRILNSQYN